MDRDEAGAPPLSIADRIARKLGYAPKADVLAAYKDGHNAYKRIADKVISGQAETHRRRKRELDEARAAAQGFRAQRDVLQSLYDKANKRLEKAGLISVTTFV